MKFVYDHVKDLFLSCGTSPGPTTNASCDFINDNIKMVLVQTGVGHYVASSGDQFLSSISSGDRVDTSGNLTGKTISGGVANCSAVTYLNVTGPVIGAIVVYKDTGSAATSPLICYNDEATGLPVTPNGGDLVFQPDTGANKLFKI